MSTSDQIRVEAGTGRLTTSVKQPSGSTNPADFSGRSVGASSAATGVSQDILNQLQIGTLGGGASLFGRRETNTFFFRGIEGENGITVRTTPTSVVVGFDGEVGTGGPGLPSQAGNEGLFLRVGANGLEWAEAGQGEQGPAGPAGADGAVGPQGPKGDQGEKLSIDQVVQTLVELDDGIVVGETAFVATEQKLYIWDGEAWVDGGEIAAIQGPAGPAGADGATGPAGPQGPQGLQGTTGPQGPQGPAGTGGGATRLVDLTDLPAITGQGGKVLAVNSAANGFEFVTPAAGGNPGAGTGNTTHYQFRINWNSSGQMAGAADLPAGWSAEVISTQEIRVSTGSAGFPHNINMWALQASGIQGKYAIRSWGTYPQSSVVYFDPAVPNSFTIFVPNIGGIGIPNSGHVLISVII